jgi:hypothetical protein
MDSLSEILGKYKSAEPPEIAAVKEYVHKQFRADANVGVQEKSVTITVPSAALANSLRLRTVQLKEICGNKRLIFRIG